MGNGGNESYLYDADGQRVRKVADVLTTFYPNAFYEFATLDGGVAAAQAATQMSPPPVAPTPPTAEVANNIYLPLIAQPDGLVQSSDLGRTTITKYYYFNGQRIAMRQDGVLTYLHGDHLGSTVLATDSSGDTVSAQGYYAYGRDRGSNSLPTDHQFTGQKKDDTGLMYYGARYYDPQIGMFVSPDTLVPDPTHVFDYNRYMYARGNPLKYNDPTGHCVFGLDTIVCIVVAAAFVGGAANATGNAGSQIYQNWESDRAMVDNLTDINKTEVGIAFGYGALAGGATPLTGGSTALLISGGIGAAQEVTTDMIVEGKSLSEAVDTETVIAAGLGVIGAKVQGAVPDELIYTASNGDELLVATGKDALAYGGERFMQNTNRQLVQEQLAYVAGGRFVTGFGVGNVPVPVPNAQAGCSLWTCPIQTVTNWWNGEEAK